MNEAIGHLEEKRERTGILASLVNVAKGMGDTLGGVARGLEMGALEQAGVPHELIAKRFAELTGAPAEASASESDPTSFDDGFHPLRSDVEIRINHPEIESLDTSGNLL